MKDIMGVENQDYCGHDDFVRFHHVDIVLPDDLIAKVEQLSLKYPKYGRDGIYAILLYDGLDSMATLENSKQENLQLNI